MAHRVGQECFVLEKKWEQHILATFTCLVAPRRTTQWWNRTNINDKCFKTIEIERNSTKPISFLENIIIIECLWGADLSVGICYCNLWRTVCSAETNSYSKGWRRPVWLSSVWNDVKWRIFIQGKLTKKPNFRGRHRRILA